MPKGRGAQHRHRSARQKGAVGCYSSRGANHCTGLHHGRAHTFASVTIPIDSTPVKAGKSSWWQRVKNWFAKRRDDVIYVVAPRQLEKRIGREYQRANAADAKNTRANSLMVRKF